MQNTDKQINVRMSLDLYRKSKKLADNFGWTLAAWIRKAMEEKVEHDNNTELAKIDAQVKMDENKVRQIALDVFRELGSGSSSSVGIDVLHDVKLKYKPDTKKR